MNILIGDDFYNYKPPSREVVITDVLKKEDKIMVDAAPGSGKSIFLIQMALSVANGKSFLDLFDVPTSAPVLYINGEMTDDDVQDRVIRIGNRLGRGVANLAYLNDRAGELRDENGMEWLLSQLAEKDFTPALTIIDPVFAAIRGSMSDDEVAMGVRRLWESYIAVTHSGLVFSNQAHRPRKEFDSSGKPTGRWYDEGRESFLGSVQWQGWVELQIPLKAPREKTLVVGLGKVRRERAQEEDIKLNLITTPTELFWELGESVTPTQSLVEYTLNQGPQTLDDLLKKVQAGRSTLRVALHKLLELGVIEVTNPTRKPLIYKKV